MVKVGIWGYGGIASIHRRNYAALEAEGIPVKLVSVCDIREEQFTQEVAINITDPNAKPLPPIEKTYTDIDDMLANEDLDMIDICLPGFMHREAAIKCLKMGYHVLSEKPMALKEEDVDAMIKVAKESKGILQIGQCLRFNPQNQFIREAIKTGKYGKVINATFLRHSSAPLWSWENWFMDKEKSGGVLFDLHCHDIDLINFFFGLPKKVSTLTTGVEEKFSGVDTAFTTLVYDDGKVVSAKADWMLPKSYQFEAKYIINFEKATLAAEKGGKLVIYTDDERIESDIMPKEHNIGAEIRYLVSRIENGVVDDIIPIESTANTIRLECAMKKSSENCGQFVELG